MATHRQIPPHHSFGFVRAFCRACTGQKSRSPEGLCDFAVSAPSHKSAFRNDGTGFDLRCDKGRHIIWLAKINYRIHTNAIKENLIPPEVTPQQSSVIYASEADVLNVALFGMTAKQWRDKNSDKKGNIRDYASINELICISNMENINAVLIEDGMSQSDRLKKLNQIAIHQMIILEEQNTKLLK